MHTFKYANNNSNDYDPDAAAANNNLVDTRLISKHSSFDDLSVAQLRFPQKLLQLIETTTDIITWNRNGTTILLNTEALDEYLLSDSSIFKTKTNLSLIRQLHHYGFKRVPRSIPKNVESPTVLEFRHQYFKEDFPENMDKVKRCGALTAQDRHYISGTKQTVNQRIRLDPCFKRLKGLSLLERSRLRLKLVLQMEKLRYLIVQKVEECRESNNFVIELTADKFENTIESAFNLNQSHIAGYYGEVENNAIRDFFGPYLPTYANEDDEFGSVEYQSESNDQPMISSQNDTQTPYSEPKQEATLDYQLNYTIAPVLPTHTSATAVSSIDLNENVNVNSTFGEFTEIHYDTNENRSIENEHVLPTNVFDGNFPIVDQLSQQQQQQHHHHHHQPEPVYPIDQNTISIKWELDMSNSGDGNSNGTIHIRNDPTANAVHGFALDLSYAGGDMIGGVSAVGIGSADSVESAAGADDDTANKESNFATIPGSDSASDIFSEIRESIDILYD